MDTRGWLVFSAVWLVMAFGCSAALAWWIRRLHPGLSFYRLWAVLAIVLQLAAALVFALGRL